MATLDLGKVVGSDGNGVPSGGTTGQWLRKKSASDYDTEWSDLSGVVKLSNSASFHNAIYWGRNIGTALTADQIAAIQAGTFADLFVGDYWQINSVKWRIAGFDLYLHSGDTKLNKHHVIVVPDEPLCEQTGWNRTDNTVTGGENGGAGYIDSKVRIVGIKGTDGAESQVIAAFGSTHVLSYRAFYPSAYNSSGEATAAAWTDAKVELMNEIMVCGHHVWTNNGHGNGFEVGVDKQQLPLFALNPLAVNHDSYYWLRSVADNEKACRFGNLGYIINTLAKNGGGRIRPFALIG